MGKHFWVMQVLDLSTLDIALDMGHKKESLVQMIHSVSFAFVVVLSLPVALFSDQSSHDPCYSPLLTS